jgi:hypothetical protein
MASGMTRVCEGVGVAAALGGVKVFVGLRCPVSGGATLPGVGFRQPRSSIDQRDVWFRSSATSFAVTLDGSLPKRPVT